MIKGPLILVTCDQLFEGKPCQRSATLALPMLIAAGGEQLANLFRATHPDWHINAGSLDVWCPQCATLTRERMRIEAERKKEAAAK